MRPLARKLRLLLDAACLAKYLQLLYIAERCFALYRDVCAALGFEVVGKFPAVCVDIAKKRAVVATC